VAQLVRRNDDTAGIWPERSHFGLYRNSVRALRFCVFSPYMNRVAATYHVSALFARFLPWYRLFGLSAYGRMPFIVVQY
jgi:hypothetical protein